MIEEPFCSSGRNSSPIPARGPEPISARSLAIFVSETARPSARPTARPARRGCPAPRTGPRAARISSPVASVRRARTRVGELLVGVQPGAGRGAAERDLSDLRERVADPARAEPHLRGVAGELLPERDRNRVHQVRAAGLDDVVELGRLRAAATASSCSSAGSSSFVASSERREVDRRREHVVGGLAHVDVVVGMSARRRRAFAITSLAFMFDEVPEPVWKTSIGNWSSNSPVGDAVRGGGDPLGAAPRRAARARR